MAHGGTSSARPSVLLVTSNGTGMGHLTRQSAVARAIGDRAEVTMLSLSSGLAVVAAQGLRSEYLPSYQQPWIPTEVWHTYLGARIVALVEELRADVLVFDGVYPYRGLCEARMSLPHTAFVWVRRGMWRPGGNLGALRTEPFFDLVIEPGDFADAADVGATVGRTARAVPPISVLDVIEPLERAVAADRLGLDPRRQTALVTLGSGGLGDSSDASAESVALLLGAGWQVATTRAVLAVDGQAIEGVHTLQQVYPLAAYVRAFDLVVSAAGYNAVHEFVAAGLPTVLVPNALTATDHQVARAREVARLGAAISTGESGISGAIDNAISSMSALGASAAELAHRRRHGAQAAADLVLDLARDYSGDAPTAWLRVQRYRYLTSNIVKRSVLTVLGPRLSQALLARRRARRGSPVDARLHLDLVVDADLAGLAGIADGRVTGVRVGRVTSELDVSLLRSDDPLEHVLAGTSGDYVRRRIRIAAEAYVVSAVVARKGDGSAPDTVRG